MGSGRWPHGRHAAGDQQHHKHKGHGGFVGLVSHSQESACPSGSQAEGRRAGGQGACANGSHSQPQGLSSHQADDGASHTATSTSHHHSGIRVRTNGLHHQLNSPRHGHAASGHHDGVNSVHTDGSRGQCSEKKRARPVVQRVLQAVLLGTPNWVWVLLWDSFLACTIVLFMRCVHLCRQCVVRSLRCMRSSVGCLSMARMCSAPDHVTCHCTAWLWMEHIQGFTAKALMPHIALNLGPCSLPNTVVAPRRCPHASMQALVHVQLPQGTPSAGARTDQQVYHGTGVRFSVNYAINLLWFRHVMTWKLCM